jgi:hypothetical protein
VPTRRVRLPTSNDTRLLVVGVAAFVALVAYLGVAFANTRATVDVAKEVAPWTPFASTLVPIPWRPGRHTVLVLPATKSQTGDYGAIVQTLVPNPTVGRRYVVRLWLHGARPGRIGVEVNEFRPGVARYPVNTTVPATARWHHFTFSLHVNATWLGLAVYVYRPNQRPPTWFAVRDLTAEVYGR